MSSTAEQSLKVLWLEVNSPTGEFIIGHGHAPLVSLLSPNSKIMYKKPDGLTGTLAIPGGILAVNKNSIRVFLRTAPSTKNKS